MDSVIHGGATNIHAQFSGVERFKFFLFAGEGILNENGVQFDVCHRSKGAKIGYKTEKVQGELSAY